MTLTRRQMFASLGLSGLTLATSGATLRAFHQAAGAPAGPFTLAPLPYPANALEPHIDAETMQIHHSRHHQAYVDALNVAIGNAGAAGKMPLVELLSNLSHVPEHVRASIRNNGGGHWNHTQFWTLLAPNAGGAPTGAIADGINSSFGNLTTFKEMFAAAAIGRFGSGWAWLSEDNGKLIIHSTANQDTPAMENKRAIFGLDLWEHAYYLTYRNRRADYINAFWNVIDWTEVNRRLKA